MTNIEVTAYYRSNGTFVKGHFRKGFRKSDDLLPDDKFMKDYYPKKE